MERRPIDAVLYPAKENNDEGTLSQSQRSFTDLISESRRGCVSHQPAHRPIRRIQASDGVAGTARTTMGNIFSASVLISNDISVHPYAYLNSSCGLVPSMPALFYADINAYGLCHKLLDTYGLRTIKLFPNAPSSFHPPVPCYPALNLHHYIKSPSCAMFAALTCNRK